MPSQTQDLLVSNLLIATLISSFVTLIVSYLSSLLHFVVAAVGFPWCPTELNKVWSYVLHRLAMFSVLQTPSTLTGRRVQLLCIFFNILPEGHCVFASKVFGQYFSS